jgi:nicotinate-nucleotide adenylyltransferase
VAGERREFSKCSDSVSPVLVDIGRVLELRKIGIYGGTFDPIHQGHLILARDARERFELETIILVPAATSPFKEAPVASPADRLAMLKAAVQGDDGFAIDEFEIQRPPPSYTINTVENIQKREGKAELIYLIGGDNVSSLTKWRRFDDLQKVVRFVVLDRTGFETNPIYPVVQRKIDISATEIRKRVALRRSIRYLVPEAVAEIIHRRGLYQET